jgi:hypothetical protein
LLVPTVFFKFKSKYETQNGNMSIYIYIFVTKFGSVFSCNYTVTAIPKAYFNFKIYSHASYHSVTSSAEGINAVLFE